MEHDQQHITEKTALSREALRDVNEIALWAGAQMMSSGAETDRIEETVHHIGTGLGANWLDILVSPNAVVVTSSSGDEFRTRLRRVPVLGVNMRVLDRINALSRQITTSGMDRAAAREELRQISHLPHNNPFLVAALVGVACAAFARLFGGGAADMGITFLGAAVAQYVRYLLNHGHFNPFLITIVTSMVASIIALAPRSLGLTTSYIAFLSSVLLLIPGVHLINAAEDLLKGHLVTGFVRGMLGALLTGCIALGMMIAMWLLQSPVI